MLLSGSRPKYSATIRWTRGIRVEPPTRMTLSSWVGRTPATRMASSQTSNDRAMSGWAMRSRTWRESANVRSRLAPPSP